MRMQKETNYRSIARILKVNPQCVVNWVNQYTATLPNVPANACESKKGRIGRVIYVCRQGKNEIYVLTVVDQDTRCVLSWDVVLERTTDALQACLNPFLKAPITMTGLV